MGAFKNICPDFGTAPVQFIQCSFKHISKGSPWELHRCTLSNVPMGVFENIYADFFLRDIKEKRVGGSIVFETRISSAKKVVKAVPGKWPVLTG